MRTQLFHLAFLLTLITPQIAFAQGGPPLITDDPDTPGDHHWENNIALMVDTTPAGKVIQTPNIDLNYGYGEHLQLNYQAGVIGQRIDHQPYDTGMTQETLGLKWRFIDPLDDKHGLSISTYPKYSFYGPISSPSTDLTPKASQWQLPVQVKFAAGAFASTTEVGRTFSASDQSSWFYGTVLGYSWSEGSDFMFELHGDTDLWSRQNDWLVNFGTRQKVNDTLDIIAALGRFMKSIGPEPESLIYAGIALHQ